MKVGDYIIGRIATAGCDTVFGVYGAANGGLIDAFHRIEGIKFIAMQSEQTAGFAAEGYAKTRNARHSHAFGCAIATSGPGGQNFVTPLGNCFYDSVPCLFITGQVNSRFMGDGTTRQVGFQETPITAIVAPITKHAFLVKAAHEVGVVMDRALALMHEGRPGPVLIDIPQDIQNADIDPEQLVRSRAAPVAGSSGADILDWSKAVVRELGHRHAPALLVGGGAAGSDVADFAKQLGVPTFPTWNALSIIPSDHVTYCGRIGTYGGRGFNRGIQGADFVLALGSRISGRIYGGAGPDHFAPNARIFAVDIDPGTCALLKSTFGDRITTLQTDVASAIRAIRRAMCDAPVPDWSGWIKRCYDWKNCDPVLPGYFHQTAVHPYAALRTLSELAPSNAIITPDCGGNLCIANHSFETKRGQTYFSSNGNSPMGFAVGAAIGAYYADPGRPVIAIIGDGGFQINIQELQTVAHNKLPIKIVLVNNGIYGITSQYQRTNFADRQIANGTLLNPGDYSTPDFGEICEAYNIGHGYISTNEMARPVFQAMLHSSRSQVIEIECPGFDTYLPRMAGAKPIDQMELPT